MNQTYLEKLKDPRWQKKRLEVMERDKWKCLACDSKNKTLNVHHTEYVRGRKPWEHPLESMVTLCGDCHKSELEERPEIEQILLQVLRKKFFSSELLSLAEMLNDFDRNKLPFGMCLGNMVIRFEKFSCQDMGENPDA